MARRRLSFSALGADARRGALAVAVATSALMASALANGCTSEVAPVTGSSPACVPGASISCAGPAGCQGHQVCNPEGSAYDACDCGGTSDAGCVPGQSIACAGPGGCQGDQICKADGLAYGACDCGDA